MQLKKMLIQLIFKYKFYLLLILISGLIITISTSSIPYYIGLGFQGTNNSDPFYGFTPLIFLSVFYLLRSAFKLIRNHLAAKLGTSIVMDLRLYTIDVYTKNYHQTNSSSDIYSLLTYDLDTITNIISFRSFVFIEDMLILILSFIKMIAISPIVFLSICPFLLGLFITSVKYGKQLNPIIFKIRKSLSNISEVIYESIIAQKVIRTLNAQNSISQKFKSYNSENLSLTNTLNRYHKLTSPLLELFAYLCMLTSVVLSGYLVAMNELDLSAVITFYGYMTLLIGTSNSLSGVITFYINSKQGILRILESFKDVEEASDTDHSKFSGKINEIILKNIVYHIDGKRILNNISLELKKGTIITITGEIGSGKSTLADIIAGMNSRFAGNMTINGKDLKDIDIKKYRENIGYSTQMPVFFNGSIFFNITLGRNYDMEQQIINTLTMCAVNEIADKFKTKYDTLINKDANFLSGGEKQRISIARALVSDPQVLIIDDTITAIDSNNLKKILVNIQEIKKDKIIIIISNYKSVFDISDEVFELNCNSFKKIK